MRDYLGFNKICQEIPLTGLTNSLSLPTRGKHDGGGYARRSRVFDDGGPGGAAVWCRVCVLDFRGLSCGGSAVNRLQRGGEWFLFLVYFVVAVGLIVSVVSVGLYELACASGWLN